MEKLYKTCLLTLSLLAFAIQAYSQSLGENSKISLLTCSPGKEVWSNYGHSAIRVEDEDLGLDLSFNYGLFSFEAPHFVWRFCTGQTDYCVGAFRTQSFMREYIQEGRSITAQVLNLSLEDRNAIWNALCENILPENRYYRYNFFYNNCATKVRDIIEDNISVPIQWSTEADYGTMRDIVKHYASPYPWNWFGVSLLLGAPADEPAGSRDQMFAPEIMSEAFARASVGGESLVSDTVVLSSLDESVEFFATPFMTPAAVLWLLFALTLLLTAAEQFLLRRRIILVDALLYGLAGVMGIVIAFLAFFSVHPAVGPNYLLFLVNPLMLFYAIALAVKPFRGSTFENCCLGAFALSFVLWLMIFRSRQYVQGELILLSCSLICRAVSSFVFQLRSKTVDVGRDGKKSLKR